MTSTRRVVSFTEFLKEGGAEKLSPRFAKVATMISEGKTLEEIAIELCVIKRRVKQFCNQIARIIDHYELERQDNENLEALVKSGLPLSKIKLDEVPLTVATYNCLRNAGCKNLGDVSRKNDAELCRIKGMGDIRIAEIKQILERFHARA